MPLRVSFSSALFRTLFGLAALAHFAAPASAVTIDWVFVGNPGNAPDAPANCFQERCGSVGYSYFIGKYEVTNAQYAEFLNTKAAVDPLGLYNAGMGSDPQGGITRSGTIGSYVYAVKPGFADKPVNFVSFYDALRFINWLGNGQGGGDTEDGAYTLLGGTPTPSNGATIAFKRGTIFLPSENEWYKAAYYDPATESYFANPARSNTATGCEAPTGTANRANCDGAVGGVTRVGAYAGSASPYGTFDQGGNVWEWNEQSVASGSLRGIRGGSWNLSAGPLAASNPNFNSPTVESHNVGFRVASLVPEPDASLLAAAALASLVALRKRAVRNP